jgi:hypothetical protein
MRFRKLSRIEIIILLSFVNTAALLGGYILWKKQPNRDFYLPEGYAGWVRIRYSTPGAPPLEVKEGVLQLHVPESGLLETSTVLRMGWRRDRYFWQKAAGPEPIPPYVEAAGGEPRIWLHSHQYFARSYDSLAYALSPGKDTTLPDGTRLQRRSSRMVSYTPGDRSLEYFYISANPEPLSFVPDTLIAPEALQSARPREILARESAKD